MIEVIIEAAIKSLIVIIVLLGAFAYLVLVERWVQARIQVRWGPNRVGPLGLFQPIADAIKAIMKEDVIPDQADKVIFVLAPGIALSTSLLAFAVIPLGEPVEVLGRTVYLSIANPDIGILYWLAIAGLGVYGVVLAGWSSGNKYALLGSLRSTAQLISYELALGLSIIGVILLVGSLSLPQIVAAQGRVWFVLPQFFGWVIFFVASLAETNRLPFDLPEAETELIAGYHLEYSSIKWALFQMAEYINIITINAIGVCLFWGGYQSPLFFLQGSPLWLLGVPSPLWFLGKLGAFIFVFMWIRATLPRLRYDQLMRFGWQLLLPLAILNVVVTSFTLAFM